MTAVAALLYGLPLQSEEADGGDVMEAKSRLFQVSRYQLYFFYSEKLQT